MSLRQYLFQGALTALLFSLPNAFALDTQLSADYVRDFESSDPSIFMSLKLNEVVAESLTLYLNQDLTKNIVIDSETDEWEFADTRLGLAYKFPSSLDYLSFTLSSSVTIPVSKTSQHSEIYSKPQLKGSMGLNFFEALTLGFGAFVRDTVSPYETAPAEKGEGGRVLSDYDFGFDHSLSLSGYGFACGYGMSYVETHYHKQDRKASEQRDYRNQLPKQGYTFNLFISRDLWQGAELNLAYLTGSALSQAGYEDYVIYDSEESSYSIGFSQNF